MSTDGDFGLLSWPMAGEEVQVYAAGGNLFCPESARLGLKIIGLTQFN